MLIKNKRIFNILDSESYMLGVVIEANRAEKNMLTIYAYIDVLEKSLSKKRKILIRDTVF